MNFRYRLMRFLSDRYGTDALFFILFGMSALLALVNVFVRSLWLQIGVYLIMFYAIFRAMSRNTAARAKENRAVLDTVNIIKGRINLHRQRKADYTHIYKRCPHCRAVLRLPRKKGKHNTVCPRCNKPFSVRVYRE